MKSTLAFATFAISLLPYTSSIGQEQLFASVFKDGDFWQFIVKEQDIKASSSIALGATCKIKCEVRYEEGKLKLFYFRNENVSEEIAFDEESADLRRLLMEDERKKLSFPLFSIKKWSVYFQYQPRGVLHSLRKSGNFAVTGVEMTTTAAGTFKTFKIEGFDRTPGGAEMFCDYSYIYYYSAETRSIVKYGHDTSSGCVMGGKQQIELIKYGNKNTDDENGLVRR